MIPPLNVMAVDFIRLAVTRPYQQNGKRGYASLARQWWTAEARGPRLSGLLTFSAPRSIATGSLLNHSIAVLVGATTQPLGVRRCGGGLLFRF
jgi:hypothetical protein